MSGDLLDTAIIYYYMGAYTEARAIRKAKEKDEAKKEKTKRKNHRDAARSVLPPAKGGLMGALCLDAPSCKLVLGMRGVLYER